jgi:hypothetical protein
MPTFSFIVNRQTIDARINAPDIAIAGMRSAMKLISFQFDAMIKSPVA